MKPTEPMWAAKRERVRMWAMRSSSLCVSQSIRLTDALDPLGLRLTRVAWRAFLREMQTSERTSAETVSLTGCKTRALLVCSQLLTAVVTYVCVCNAICVSPCVVGADCVGGRGKDTGRYWSYWDFWPTPPGPPSRSSLSACARLWVEAARRRLGPWCVKNNKKKKDYIFLG